MRIYHIDPSRAMALPAKCGLGPPHHAQQLLVMPCIISVVTTTDESRHPYGLLAQYKRKGVKGANNRGRDEASQKASLLSFWDFFFLFLPLHPAHDSLMYGIMCKERFN
ncbi:hypothetical protein GQ55_2G096100 [Panicum hallii var. hallii]|uniref:Uncharacterized protein n=1 Tax=Panicum hallii var. hallii TaxID=1504633 RepID=A0A2T7EN93_9POAL|nr:hypothetical protein GQ55_2G096100 [Panicum hallii var. hallii]